MKLSRRAWMRSAYVLVAAGAALAFGTATANAQHNTAHIAIVTPTQTPAPGAAVASTTGFPDAADALHATPTPAPPSPSWGLEPAISLSKP